MVVAVFRCLLKCQKVLFYAKQNKEKGTSYNIYQKTLLWYNYTTSILCSTTV